MKPTGELDFDKMDQPVQSLFMFKCFCDQMDLNVE